MTARYESSDPDTFHRTLDRALHPSPADTLLKAAAQMYSDADRCGDKLAGFIPSVAAWLNSVHGAMVPDPGRSIMSLDEQHALAIATAYLGSVTP